MKAVFFYLMVTAAAFAGEADYSNWSRVMTDHGSGPAFWRMTSDYGNWQKKVLDMETAPSEIRKAAVEYEIFLAPYDPELKCHVNAPESHPWGNWQIKVNGKIVFCRPAGKYIGKGTHRIEISVGSLKEGVNTIELGWEKLSAEERKTRKYGYVYFAVDDNKEEKAHRKDPKYVSNGLRIRLLVDCGGNTAHP